MSRFGCHFGRFWPPKASRNFRVDPPFSGLEVALFLTCYLCDVLVGSKSASETPKRPQEAPKSAPRGPKTPPRAPQEAPRGPQETPRAGQEGSRPSKIAPRGSKRHRRRLRSPKSTYPKGLAPNRRKKKKRAGGGDPPWGSRSYCFSIVINNHYLFINYFLEVLQKPSRRSKKFLRSSYRSLRVSEPTRL